MEIPRDWINVSGATSDMRLCQVSFQESAGCPPLVVTRSLVVKEDRSWQVHVHSHPIDLSIIPTIAGIPSELDRESATLLLSQIAELQTCVGNPEPKFIALGEAKKNGRFLSAAKEVVAYIDRSACVAVGGLQYPSTVRCSKCHLLTNNVRCSECITYRKNLIAQHSRASRHNSSEQSKKINYRYVPSCLHNNICMYMYV